jgi:hypothetical protein
MIPDKTLSALTKSFSVKVIGTNEPIPDILSSLRLKPVDGANKIRILIVW